MSDLFVLTSYLDVSEMEVNSSSCEMLIPLVGNFLVAVHLDGGELIIDSAFSVDVGIRDAVGCESDGQYSVSTVPRARTRNVQLSAIAQIQFHNNAN